MAGNLGEIPLAAHSVLQNVGFFMFPLTFGISTATTVRIGSDFIKFMNFVFQLVDLC